MITNCLPSVHTEQLLLINSQQNYEAYLCLCNSNGHLFDFEIVDKYLHDKEIEYFKQLKIIKRKKDFLLGRYVAKTAISFLAPVDDLSKIHIDWGVFSQPIIKSDLSKNIQVCITHCDNLCAAIAFPEDCPIGIDIESTCIDRVKFLESCFTDNEKILARRNSDNRNYSLVLLWTLKEALSKALKIGMTSPFELFEINNIESKNGCYLIKYKNFGQFVSCSTNIGEYILSMAYPSTMELNIDTSLLNDILRVDSIQSPTQMRKQM